MKDCLAEMYRNAAGTVIPWDVITHFDQSEWGDHLRETAALLICALDKYREDLGCPVWISPANWGTHGATSYHYPSPRSNNKIWAVDIFPDCPLVWAYHTAIKSKTFGGIGVYPDWHWRGKNLSGGLHLDIREYSTIKKLWYHDNEGYHGVRNQDDLSEMEILMLAIS